MGKCLDSDVVLCTDSATNYKSFANKKGIPHEILNAHKGVRVKQGIYHIQHVNAYHHRLKKWMERFKGIGTKYIDNYLFWFRFLELHKQLNKKLRKQTLLFEACRGATFSPVRSFKSAS
jgi:hypothetical protein